MIEALFLLAWTALFFLIAYFSWIKIDKIVKLYLMMFYNCLYLLGVFVVYPRI